MNLNEITQHTSYKWKNWVSVKTSKLSGRDHSIKSEI